MSRRTLTRIAKAMAMLLVSIAGAVAIAEVMLRAIHFTGRLEQQLSPAWRWIVSDPVLGAKNRPGHVEAELGFTINALGFRGPEISVQKRPGTLRVACLGDSTTFGVWKAGPFSMYAHTSYPQELAKLLGEEGLANVEVINAGVLGSDTAHGLRVLLAQILWLEPDIVTLRYGNNDHALGRDATGWESTAVASLLPASVYHWEVVRLLFHAGGMAFPVSPPGLLVHRLTVAQFTRNLHRFVALGEQNGFKVLFLDFPFRPIERGESPGESFPNPMTPIKSLQELHDLHEGYQVAVRAVARETGTPLVETATALRESPVEVFTDYDLSHPNEAGAQLIARLLRDGLRAQGWLTSK